MADSAKTTGVDRRGRRRSSTALEKRVRELELQRMLSGPQDRADAIVSINPGAGGIDAQDWAEMLMRMYLRWCERKGFKTEIVEPSAGRRGGHQGRVVHRRRAPHAYGFLRAENGVHRLIRISPFDSNARRHTAFAAVFVVPDLGDDDVDEIEIKPEDLKVDTYRASGAGGQHVNKTESAIRITHIPIGHRGRVPERALAAQEPLDRDEDAGAVACTRRRARSARPSSRRTTPASQMAIGFGSQVRSYTLQPYTLVKDERTEHKSTQRAGRARRRPRRVHRGVSAARPRTSAKSRDKSREAQ